MTNSFKCKSRGNGDLLYPYSLVPDPQNFSNFLNCGVSVVHGWILGGYGLGEGGIIHNGPVRFWVSVVVCPLDGRPGHFPIPCATDDGWGVSLNPSVSVIDEDRC
jgi:hypothetical protein